MKIRLFGKLILVMSTEKADALAAVMGAAERFNENSLAQFIRLQDPRETNEFEMRVWQKRGGITLGPSICGQAINELRALNSAIATATVIVRSSK